MNKNITSIFILIFLSTKIFAIMEFFDMQKDFANGDFRISTYLNYSEFTTVLKKTSVQNILVDISGKQYEYFSSVLAEYEAKILTNSFNIGLSSRKLFTYNLFYKIKFGIIYDKYAILENGTKKLYSKDSDYNFGLDIDFGLGYILFPETFVNPSVILTSNINVVGISFNTVSDTYNTNTNLSVLDYSVGIVLSKKISKYLHPYFGTKLISRTSFLVDKTNNYNISGENFLFNLNLGNMFYIRNKRCFNIEISWSPKNISVSFGTLIPNILINNNFVEE